MRKLIALVLCVILTLCLYGCQNDTSDTQDLTAADPSPFPVVDYSSKIFMFPEGAVVCGVDLSGMTIPKAYTILNNTVSGYNLRININNRTAILWADDFDLQFSSELMDQYVSAIKDGNDPRSIIPVTYNEGQLKYALSLQLNILPKDVSLVYNAETDSFDFTEPVLGTAYELDPVIDALKPVILSLESQYTTTAKTVDLAPTYTADNTYAIDAQNSANKLLSKSLTYTFTPDNSQTKTATIEIDDLGSFFTFDSSLNPVVNKTAVADYVARLSDEFSVGTNDGKFLTSLGEYIDFEIYYADQFVDTAALTDDIVYCLENGITGTRVAPYLPAEKGLAHDLGGNYVEVNLTEQCLWVYNNYECVVYTPIVTGSLGNGWGTPNGAFAVVYKEIGATLMGLDVTYWMPFYGNYGLHDAPWRTVYEKEEYLFNGSHGCVNIPPVNADDVFRNVSWGTPVIVYGGAHYGDIVTQELTGTTEYNVGVDVGTFKLDTTPKYGPTSRLTYTSNNTDIVTVSSKGVVTVLGTGTAKITIESPDWDFCPSDQIVVTINVHDSCSETGHMIVNWKETATPTCTANGTETGVCSAPGCSYSESRTIEKTHKYRSWTVTVEPTCTETGEKSRTCRYCDHEETAIVEATGHMTVDWKITKRATETEAGELTGTCYHCDLVATKEIPVIE